VAIPTLKSDVNLGKNENLIRRYAYQKDLTWRKRMSIEIPYYRYRVLTVFIFVVLLVDMSFCVM